MHRVVCGALVRDRRVLLVHRSPHRRAFPDVWDLPGGHLEPGESELSALERELHEELGVRITQESAARLCRLTVGRSGDLVLLSAWLVGLWQGTPTNLALDEHDRIGWFRLEEIPALAHRRVDEAIRGLPDLLEPPRTGATPHRTPPAARSGPSDRRP